MHSILSNAPVWLAQAGQQPSGWQQLIATFFPFIVLFAILYLLWIRPEQKRAKAHRELVKHLKVGDPVVTTSGIHGTVSAVKDSTVHVKVAENVDIEIERVAIARVEGKTAESEGK